MRLQEHGRTGVEIVSASCVSVIEDTHKAFSLISDTAKTNNKIQRSCQNQHKSISIKLYSRYNDVIFYSAM